MPSGSSAGAQPTQRKPEGQKMKMTLEINFDYFYFIGLVSLPKETTVTIKERRWIQTNRALLQERK